jgi:nucleotide-binding universal stress UspA family protein
MSETAVSLASVSTAPVLLIPAGARYFLPSHMILPTPFENLERLSDFNKLFTNSLWRNVTIDVLQIGEDLEQKDEAIQALYEYLKGYQFGIHCIPGTDTAKEILHFADTRNAALILALPGRHSFFYHLSHQNVTKKFALLSQRPVLLLK